ncbi:hypothetical protein FHS00_003300 [Limimaricola variabilis]|uniref:Uncharacterized protein n=1 Tax=Limimaricola variabilis TaxID=1492771 RepID=A0ABR6HT12_9RHOB|nr:hypothetical protein [Limimaricola variabilis]MBB3713695.1 hypothetical protein [Limimaricola variabilis]
MKKFMLAVSILAFSSSTALADKPNDKGAGGQAVKALNQDLKDTDTNLGQLKKDLGITGIGSEVSAINQDSNN